MNEFYKKKDHKVTTKKYGLLNWFGYQMHNNLIFETLIYVLSAILGIMIGIILKNM